MKKNNKVAPKTKAAPAARTVVKKQAPKKKAAPKLKTVVHGPVVRSSTPSHGHDAKERERQRNKLRRAILQKHMPEGIDYKHHPSAYLRTLVDPERFHGVRYPDSFSRATAVAHTMINHDVYTFPADNLVEPAGTYLNVVTPSMTEPLLEYFMSPSLGIGSSEDFLEAELRQQTGTYGFFPVGAGAVGLARQSGQLWLDKGALVNVIMPWSRRGSLTSEDLIISPFRGTDFDGFDFYGMPFLMEEGVMPSATTAIQLVVRCGVTSIIETTLGQVTLVSEHGSVSASLVRPADEFLAYASFTQSDLIGSVLTATSVEGVYSAGLPGVGIRMRSALDLDFIAMTSIGATMASTTLRDVPWFRNVPLPDVDVYLSKVDQYRPISSSVWMEYQGADLTNGGQAAAIMFRGGDPFGIAGLWDYDKVSVTPGSYQGALKLGSYSFWLPATERDVLMRPVAAGNRWSRPYIVNVGRVASVDLEHVLRLRIPMNFEFVSSAQFFEYGYADPDPTQIEAAAVITRAVPTSMENPKHTMFIDRLLGAGIDMLSSGAHGILDTIF